MAFERAARRDGDGRLAGEDVFDGVVVVANVLDGGLVATDVVDSRPAVQGGTRQRSPPPPGGSRSGPGIGVPWGSWLGSPSLAAISSSISSEM